MLIVVAVVALLVALLLPAVQSAREASRRATCKNRLRQWAIAAHAHHEARGHFPPGMRQRLFSSAPVYRGTGLFACLVPFVEQGGLIEKWDYTDPLNNALGGADALTAASWPLLLCPSDTGSAGPVVEGAYRYALTSYGGNGGTRSYQPRIATADGIFHTTGPASEPAADQRPVRIADVLDGTSNTLLLGERRRNDTRYETFVYVGWAESLATWSWWAPVGGRKSVGRITMSATVPINYDMPFDYASRGTVSPPPSYADTLGYLDRRLSAWGSHHPGGANFAFADGSVRFLTDELDLTLLRALSTRAGGETRVNPDDNSQP